MTHVVLSPKTSEAQELLEKLGAGDSNEDISCVVLGENEEGETISSQLVKKVTDTFLKKLTAKSFDGSTQVEARREEVETLEECEIAEPPYDPLILENFLELDETHFRCVSTKATDTVNRGYSLKSTKPVMPDAEENSTNIEGQVIQESSFIRERQEVETFIKKCNRVFHFEGVLKKGCMDFEAVGWAAFEVIRSADKKIRRLYHVPASRIRVLEGWKGFVEIASEVSSTSSENSTYLTYYQPFGEKVLSPARINPVTGKKDFYDPEEDGELGEKTPWNLLDRVTGEYLGENASNLSKAANEILWVPKTHSNTIYYGYSDIVAAAGHVVNKVHIKDYILQFFEHNTVPRYAVIVEGAQVDEKIEEALRKYFEVHIKGRSHKTLVLGVPSKAGRPVSIKFEKLQEDEQEASFQETQKNSSQAIMVAHGVSPAIIGINETASLGSGKGLSQAEIYKDRSVTPNQKLWANHVNDLFHRGLGVTLVDIEFNPLDIRDREAEMRTLTSYHDRGIVNNNEVRESAKIGSPVPGGNRHYFSGGKSVTFVDELEDLKSPQKLDEEKNSQEKDPPKEQSFPSKDLGNANDSDTRI